MSATRISRRDPADGDLCFHVIYTPGTFSYLGPLLTGVLDATGFSFRLVLNGHSPDDHTLAEAFAASSPRLKLTPALSAAPVSHGQALDALWPADEGEFFCFMDSDILGSSKSLEALRSHLTDHDAIFSGKPIWQGPDEDILPADAQQVLGRHLRTPAGRVLGSSYFALYRRELLERAAHTYGLGFGARRWDELPPKAQLSLVGTGLQFAGYDTGKVLNLLLTHEKARTFLTDLPDLLHLGGLSLGFRNEQQGEWDHRERVGPPATRHKKRLGRYLVGYLKFLRNGQPRPQRPRLTACEACYPFGLVERRLESCFRRFEAMLASR